MVVKADLWKNIEGEAVLEKRNGLHWLLSAMNWFWSIRVRGALSYVYTIQFKVVTGTLISQKYQDQILKSGVRPPLDSLDGQNMVLRDDIARLHLTMQKSTEHR